MTNICFIPANNHFLPKNNHPILTNFEEQKAIIEKFQETEKEVAFKTYPNLLNLLKEIYSEEENFNFLDFGGIKLTSI